MGKKPDFQLQIKRLAYNEAMQNLLESQDAMELISKPRNYTQKQNILMSAVVGYIYGPQRSDIMGAAVELTENIQIVAEIAPSDPAQLTAES